MKKGLLVGMLMVMAVGVYGESFTIVHNFRTMGSPRIVYSDAGKTATTDSVVYHCFKNAKFDTYSGLISLYMEGRNDSIVTSKIEGLKRIKLYYYPSNVDRYETISIKVSRDGSSWTDHSSIMSHDKGIADVILPRRGDYFVKIINTTSSVPFYVFQCDWRIELCNCFEYIPE